MKVHKSLLTALVAGALAFAGAAAAQDNSMSTSEQAASNQAAASQTATSQTSPSTTLQTAQGTVVINSTSAPAPQIAPPPPFKQLSGGSKWITEDQAAAYPPLANDFLHASHNGKRISKAQYESWVKQLK